MSSKKSQSSSKGRGKKADGAPKKTEEQSRGSADDRTDRRVPIQLLVDYKSGGNYLFDFCKDLGTGGVFIQTDKPLPTGSPIDLTFTIPDSKETLSAKGTVIWVQSPVAARRDLTPGMGVQFSSFSGEQRRVLEDFVQRYHGSKKTVPVTDSRKRAG